MPRKSHTHQYILRPTGSNPVWACALDYCNHYMPSHLTSLVEGRMSLCWDCNTPFKLDLDAMKADNGKPICHVCRVVSGRTLASDIIQDGTTPTTKTDDERRAELLKPVVEALAKCKKCNERPIMASETHGMCARCAISRFVGF